MHTSKRSRAGRCAVWQPGWGVAPASIARWRSGRVNVATEYAEALIKALKKTMKDLANDLKVEQVCLPIIKARGRRNEKPPT